MPWFCRLGRRGRLPLIHFNHIDFVVALVILKFQSIIEIWVDGIKRFLKTVLQFSSKGTIYGPHLFRSYCKLKTRAKILFSYLIFLLAHNISIVYTYFSCFRFDKHLSNFFNQFFRLFTWFSDHILSIHAPFKTGLRLIREGLHSSSRYWSATPMGPAEGLGKNNRKGSFYLWAKQNFSLIRLVSYTVCGRYNDIKSAKLEIRVE